MLSRELKSQYSSEVESRMPREVARTGSERGGRATQQWATGPYSTEEQRRWPVIQAEDILLSFTRNGQARFIEPQRSQRDTRRAKELIGMRSRLSPTIHY